MKKRWIALFSALLLVLLAAGCGGTAADSPLAGKWKVAAASMSGITIGAESLGEFNIEIKGADSGSMTVDGTTSDISWKQDGDKITFDVSGTSMTATVKDNAIMTFDDFMGMGMSVTFVKEGANVDMTQFQTTQ